MTFSTGIVRTVAEGLKRFTSRVKPKYPSQQSVKSLKPRTAPLHDPRFTREQLEKLRAASEQHPAR